MGSMTSVELSEKLSSSTTLRAPRDSNCSAMVAPTWLPQPNTTKSQMRSARAVSRLCVVLRHPVLIERQAI
jgi:hypothetical protein